MNQNFRRSVLQSVVLGVSWTALFVLFSVFGLWLTGSGRNGSIVMHPLIFGLPVVFTALGLALSWHYGVMVSPAALRIRSSSGRMVDIAWSAIERAELMSLLGLPLLRVSYAGEKRPGLLPLWLSDLSAFIANCRTYAGDHHVLVRWFKDHPRAGRFRFFNRGSGVRQSYHYGFVMLQYSVYARHCPSEENAKMHAKRVEQFLPADREVGAWAAPPAAYRCNRHHSNSAVPIRGVNRANALIR